MTLPRETLATGAATQCPTCHVVLTVDIHRSNAGWYIGTWCECGPHSRESGYFRTAAKAREALRVGGYRRG